MPLTKKGSKIKAAMAKQYGAKKGEQVFYASINKGTVTGAEKGVHWSQHHFPGSPHIIGERTSRKDGAYRMAGGHRFKDFNTKP